MTPDGKRKLIIGGSILAIAAIVGAVLYKQRKSTGKTQEEETPPAPETDKLTIESQTTPVITTGATTPSTSSGGYSGGGAGKGGGGYTADQVYSFQKFANNKGWSPKLVEDGSWGSKTAAAFAVHGSAWLKAVAQQLGGAGVVVPTGGGNPLGKKVYVGNKYVNVRLFSEPRIAIGYFDNTFVGLILKGIPVGTVIASAKSKYDGKVWYEVKLMSAPLTESGIGNPYAKTAWVRADVVKF